MRLLAILLVAIVACGGAGDDGYNAVVSAGFDNVVIGDAAIWYSGCGRDDSYNSYFTATNAQGRRVSGVVCCGTGAGCGGKACTVRF
jgi:hypothetical protein